MGIISLLLLLSCQSGPDTSHLEKDLLRLQAKIALPGVGGRIDHLSYDEAGRRIFVAALGHNTVEVVDLATRARVYSITGLHEPQGVLYLASTGRLVVANGGSGDCVFYDGKSYTEQGKVALGDDADNIRSDGEKVYVGYGNGAIAVIESKTIRRLGDLPLKGHPESFQLGDSGRIYINIPDEEETAAGDLRSMSIQTHWKNSGASANFPMALDRAGGRLFVAYRHPAQLRMLDVRTGAVQASTPCVGDADDVFYDQASGLVFVSGGEGYLDVFRGTVLVDHIVTRKGARTCLWLPADKQLILAVPARGGEGAALWVYGM
ncbi:MAG: YncE family protein [Bacteroidetes bacterium]|nr:YncE family protein [Bacteroidota bacterium]